MILTALKDYAEREGLAENADFQPMPVRWLIDINKGGQFLRVTDTLQKPEGGKGKAVACTALIPKRSKRTSGVSSEFIVDKAAYVLGWVHPEKLEGESEAKVTKLRERVAEGHELYLNELRLALAATNDEGLQAWLDFLESDTAKTLELEGWTEGDLIAPRYYPDQGEQLPARHAISEYWNQRRQSPEFGTGQPTNDATANTTSTTATCTVTGKPCQPIRLHPSIKGIPPISDTKGGVPLTSINATAFASYGLDEIGCAVVSQEAADAYQTALNRLLAESYPDPKRQGGVLKPRKVQLSDSTVVVFWSKQEPLVDLFSDAVSNGDPNAVEAVFRATWKGQPIDLENPAAFYALTLSGAIGRGTVRGWHESTLGAVLKNVQRYFQQLKIAPDEGRSMPLLNLLRQTAVLGKLDNIDPNLAGEVFQAILAGRAFPQSVLAALVRRCRAERELRTDRIAFLKACLCRINYLKETDIMLVEDSTSRGYRLGRLFAVLEKLQDEAINATAGIRERYYGAASSTPVVVFPQLLRKAPHYLSKLNPGRRTNFEKLLQSVCDGLQPPTPFPATLKLEEQGLFAVGYYHQRQALFTKKETETTTDHSTTNQE